MIYHALWFGSDEAFEFEHILIDGYIICTRCSFLSSMLLAIQAWLYHSWLQVFIIIISFFAATHSNWNKDYDLTKDATWSLYCWSQGVLQFKPSKWSSHGKLPSTYVYLYHQPQSTLAADNTISWVHSHEPEQTIGLYLDCEFCTHNNLFVIYFV
jgi:hypothetical protein